MNVKKGDLAYVTWALPEYSDCIGRIVEIGEFVPPSAWHIAFAGVVPQSVASQPDLVHGEDFALRPISGAPIEDEITTDEPYAAELADQLILRHLDTAQMEVGDAQ
ncbi:hypothetical protein [Pararobbsia alpina]|uniref:Uncharacterized protein n=1 Tax=Pararobbsia alpina TaxID=621374 RepID=A0A6S7CP95_9BURK|nr:hypothetical protein [Pararobbsia alpina]CAB3784474.1 hypothetical protein LMG28138_01817 [Pararobbsia alpina]